ncbi:MAG: hypothetical protein P1U70_03540 [Saprospiraceae bacterium]|jgi:hypothetical protein|nr:hypothetical protein [Saprospiraceae bacterium]
MIKSLIMGIGGVVSLMIIWMVVQSQWRRIFSENLSEEDVLAGRTSCSNCGCTTVCKNKT